MVISVSFVIFDCIGNGLSFFVRDHLLFSELDYLSDPTYVNLMKFVIKYADGIVYAGDNIAPEIMSFVESEGKPVLVCNNQSDDYVERYYEFYEKVLQL